MDAISKLRTSLAARYEIEREIGAGGMATVYLARDQRHDRNVALKVLNPELGAVLGVERFLSLFNSRHLVFQRSEFGLGTGPPLGSCGK